MERRKSYALFFFINKNDKEAAALQQILSLFPAHLKANKRTSSDLWITAPRHFRKTET